MLTKIKKMNLFLSKRINLKVGFKNKLVRIQRIYQPNKKHQNQRILIKNHKVPINKPRT